MTGPADPPARCPDCRGERLEFVWNLPAGAGLFSETATFAADAGLWACVACGLWFRHPCPDQVTLTALYQTLPEDTWSTNVARPSWPEIWEWVMRLAPVHSVLDVGCFTGDFLAQMPGEFERLGVEPNERAGEIAARKGISIVGRSFDDIRPGRRLGAITILDVIEHVESPFKLLSTARDRVVDGGIVVVLSGNTASWPWRLVGSTYWYAAIPGHVRFLNPRWARHAAARLGMELLHTGSTRSDWHGASVFLRQGAQAIAFAFSNALKRMGFGAAKQAAVPILGRVARWTSPPWWSTAPDHAIFVFKAGTREGR